MRFTIWALTSIEKAYPKELRAKNHYIKKSISLFSSLLCKRKKVIETKSVVINKGNALKCGSRQIRKEKRVTTKVT